LQAQINVLLQQLAALQGGGSGAAPQPVPTVAPRPITICPVFEYNLYLGTRDATTGGEVTELQKFLAEDPEVYPEGEITGYFGPLTEKAVQRWQARQGLVSSGAPDTTGYGVVGPQTRSTITRICPVPSDTVISVRSPNGGEVWQKGTAQEIAWFFSSISKPNFDDVDSTADTPALVAYPVDIYLVSVLVVNCITDPCPSLPISQYTIAKSVFGNSYKWVVPFDISDGSYVVRVQRSGSYSYDDSNGPFRIVSAQDGNLPPTISGVTGPTLLKAGEEGKWTVKATDPEQKPLSYTVVWGDEDLRLVQDQGVTSSLIPSQEVTFTHVYSSVGTYVPTFTVTDNSGLSAKTSISVTVDGGTVGNRPPQIGVGTAPVSVTAGQPATFTWNATDPDRDDLVWSVTWGDGPGVGAACSENPFEKTPSTVFPPLKGWTFTQTHIWQNPGTYTVSVSVNDCRGGSDKSSHSVVVDGVVQEGVELTIAKEATSAFRLGAGNNFEYLAQSFIPPDDSLRLTSVLLGLAKRGNPTYPITVSIRESLNGPDLGSIVINPSNISTDYRDPSWFEAGFSKSLPVVRQPGKLYYLVLSVNEIDKNNFYWWSIAEDDPYNGGAFYREDRLKRRDDALARIQFVSSVPSSSRDSQRLADIKQIQLALELYFDEYKQYPLAHTTCGGDRFYGLEVLVSERFTPKLPKDPSAVPSCYFYATAAKGDVGAYHLGTRLEDIGYEALVADRDCNSNGILPRCDSVIYTNGFLGIDPVYDVTSSSRDTSSITVTSPNGGEVWQMRNTHTILWTPYDPNAGINSAFTSVEAYLDKLSGDRFVTVGKVVPAGKASIHWEGEIVTFGNYTDPGEYYIRVVNKDTGATDRSDQSFKLVEYGTLTADLKVIGSDGPITVPAEGARYSVAWDSNTESCEIVNNTIPFGSENYRITNLPPSGSRAIQLNSVSGVLSLTCTSRDAVQGTANDLVEIRPASKPFITVISPNGGEIINFSSPTTISFGSVGLKQVSLALYKNDSFFNWIVTNLPAEAGKDAGGYVWTPSDTISSANIGNDTFKIYALGYKADGSGTVDDKSDRPFSIVSGIPTFSIADVSGYKKSYGTDEKITLTIKGVEIDGSPAEPVEGFNVQVHITPQPQGTQVFAANARYEGGYWYIDSAGPFAEGHYGLSIALYCSRDESTCAKKYGIAAQVNWEKEFVVTSSISSIAVISPNGGEVWQMGSVQTVRWSASPSASISQIALITDSLPGQQIVLAVNTVNDGSESFVINESPGSYKVRVTACTSQATGGCAFDESDAQFSVVSGQTIGSLNVSLDASTPVSTKLSPGNEKAQFAAIRLRTGSRAINNMNAIQIGSDSRNASSFLTNFRIYDGSTLLSSFGSGDLVYNGNYYYAWLKVNELSIPANSLKVLTIAADVKSTAPSGSVRLGIAGLNFDSPGAEVFGTPVYGSTMTIGSVGTPSITVSSPNGGEQLEKGETYAIQWVATGFPSDGWVQVQLRDAKNPSLVNQVISLSTPIFNGRINWTVPRNIADGQYLVWVSAGSPSIPDTDSDFSDKPFSIVSGDTNSVVTIQPSKDTPGGIVVPGGGAQIVGGFHIEVSGEPMGVSFARFSFQNGTIPIDSTVLTSVALYDPKGNIVAGPKDFPTFGGAGIINFTDRFTIPVGTHDYILQAKPSSLAKGGTIITASTIPSSDWAITGERSGTKIIASPNAQVKSNSYTVGSHYLGISADAPKRDSAVAGAIAYPFTRYLLDAANSSEDIRLNQLRLLHQHDGSLLNTCQLFYGEKPLNTGSNTVDPSAGTSGLYAFTLDESFIVRRGSGSTILTLKCNIPANAAAGSTYAWGIDAVSDNVVSGATSGTAFAPSIKPSSGPWVVVEGLGLFTVEKDASSPVSRTVTAGSFDILATTLRLRGINEAIRLSQLGLQFDGSNLGALRKATIWDGNKKVGEAVFPGNSRTTKSLLTEQVIIPAYGFKALNIKVDLNITSSLSGYAKTGDTVAINYDGDNYTDTFGIGQTSGQTITSSSRADTKAGVITIGAASLTYSKLPVPTTTLPLGASTGIVLYRFSVTAPANSQGTISSFPFNLTKSGVSIPISLRLDAYRDSAFSVPALDQNPIDSGVTILGESRDVEVVFTPAQMIVPAGSTRYFELIASPSGVEAGATLTTGLQGHTSQTLIAPSAAATISKLIIADQATSAFRLGSANKYTELSQSFEAPFGKITGVVLGLAKINAPTYPVTVSIRDSIRGVPLVNTVINPVQISTDYNNPTQFNVSFPSALTLTQGKTYYLTLSVDADKTDKQNFYWWAIDDRNNPYPSGIFYRQTDDKRRYDAVATILYLVSSESGGGGGGSGPGASAVSSGGYASVLKAIQAQIDQLSTTLQKLQQ
jgi:hypothetical protein